MEGYPAQPARNYKAAVRYAYQQKQGLGLLAKLLASQFFLVHQQVEQVGNLP
jgi:hypothetical protein